METWPRDSGRRAPTRINFRRHRALAAAAMSASSSKAPALPEGMRTIGDYEIEKVDEKGGRAEPQKIKYTTRGREEARRNEVKFQGLVRRWEKRYVMVGHLRVVKWARVEDNNNARGLTPTNVGEEPAAGRKRPRS